MKSTLLSLLLLVGLTACSSLSSDGGASATASPTGSAQDSCSQFAQAGCLRLDQPSVLKGGVPNGVDGTPDFRGTLAGLRAGTIKSAGKRKITVFVWGMRPGVTPGMLAAYQRPTVDGAPVKIGFHEIDVGRAPKFDPAHQPPGVARAFEISYEGAIVSFQVPKSAIGDEMYVLVCPDGASEFPNRVTAQDGLWSLPEFWRTMRAGPQYLHATRKPVVWRQSDRQGPLVIM